VVLPMPDALPLEFDRERSRLADLRPCGGAMRSEALAWLTKVKREAGAVGGLEPAGRSGPWNPPLPLLMTSGGLTLPPRWREVADCPVTVVHQKWPSPLGPRRRQRVGTRALQAQIDAVGRTAPRGLVASVDEGTGPAGGEGGRMPWRHTSSAPRSLCGASGATTDSGGGMGTPSTRPRAGRRKRSRP